MEAKGTIRMQKVTLAAIAGNVEVLTRKQLKQIKGGDNDPLTPIKR